MSLILAIEPDRRQSAQLTNVVRRRVGAELILVDTTGQALDAIGNRVPDLLLVPALLSPQDDAALAAALRVIAAAAHVQMLTIPVLAPPRSKARSGGMLAALRRGRSPSPPEGCDPAVFAEQISSYLQAVAEERAKVVEGEEAFEEPAAHEQPVEEQTVQEQLVEQPAFEQQPVELQPFEQPALDEPVVEEVVSLADEAMPEPRTLAEPVASAAMKPPPLPVLDELLSALEQSPLPIIEQVDEEDERPDEENPDEFDIDLTDTLDEAALAAAWTIDVEPPEILEAAEPCESTEPFQMAESVAASEGVEAAEWLEGFEADQRIEESSSADDELWMALGAGRAHTWPAIEGAPAEATPDPLKEIEERPQAFVAGVPVRPSVTVVKSEHEWVELVESLRHDVERLRAGGVQPAAAGATRVVDGATGSRSSKRRAQEHTPIQDEWGFFDPQQCGFAALLAKLEEVTEPEEASSVAH